MGFYYTCNTCGKTEKGGPDCNCASDAMEKTLLQLVGTKVTGFKKGHHYMTGTKVMLELTEDDGSIRYVALSMPNVTGEFGSVNQIQMIPSSEYVDDESEPLEPEEED